MNSVLLQGWAFEFWRILAWLMVSLLGSRFMIWGLDVGPVRLGGVSLRAWVVEIGVFYLVAGWFGLV